MCRLYSKCGGAKRRRQLRTDCRVCTQASLWALIGIFLRSLHRKVLKNASLFFGLDQFYKSPLPLSIFWNHSYSTLTLTNFYFLLVLKESRDPAFNGSGEGIPTPTQEITEGKGLQVVSRHGHNLTQLQLSIQSSFKVEGRRVPIAP